MDSLELAGQFLFGSLELAFQNAQFSRKACLLSEIVSRAQSIHPNKNKLLTGACFLCPFQSDISPRIVPWPIQPVLSHVRQFLPAGPRSPVSSSSNSGYLGTWLAWLQTREFLCLSLPPRREDLELTVRAQQCERPLRIHELRIASMLDPFAHGCTSHLRA